MSEYTEMANKFLQDCDATIKIELVGKEINESWGDNAPRNHYKFTIITKRGSMTDDFWDSINSTEIFYKTVQQFAKEKYHTDYDNITYPNYGLKNKINKEYQEYKQNGIPSAYDVLACLYSWIPDTFEDFCCEFGYNDDSIKALKLYLDMQKQVSTLRKIFTAEQLEKLNEIQ